MFCEEWSLVKTRAEVLTLAPLKCRRWNCPECQPERQRQLRGKAKAGNANSFLTLTVNPAELDTPLQRAAAVVRAWRLLRLRAMRRWKLKRLPFLAVFEATKKGEPHLHILMRAPFIPQVWISEQMKDLTNAPICDIRRIKNQGMAAAYVTKYIGKAPYKFGTLKRYWCSQDWNPRDLDPDKETDLDPYKVEVWKITLIEAMKELQKTDWRFIAASKDGYHYARPPPEAAPC